MGVGVAAPLQGATLAHELATGLAGLLLLPGPAGTVLLEALGGLGGGGGGLVPPLPHVTHRAASVR